MRGLVLDNAVIAQSRIIRIPEGNPVAVLATMSTGPSITEVITPEARAIVVPFDIAQTTWPFDVSFVVFERPPSYLGGWIRSSSTAISSPAACLPMACRAASRSSPCRARSARGHLSSSHRQSRDVRPDPQGGALSR